MVRVVGMQGERVGGQFEPMAVQCLELPDTLQLAAYASWEAKTHVPAWILSLNGSDDKTIKFI